jgi:hypothetical protein
MVTKTTNGRLLQNPSYPPKITNSGRVFAPLTVVFEQEFPPKWCVAMQWVLKGGVHVVYFYGAYDTDVEAQADQLRVFPGNPTGVSGDWGGKFYNKFLRGTLKGRSP